MSKYKLYRSGLIRIDPYDVLNREVLIININETYATSASATTVSSTAVNALSSASDASTKSQSALSIAVVGASTANSALGFSDSGSSRASATLIASSASSVQSSASLTASRSTSEASTALSEANSASSAAITAVSAGRLALSAASSAVPKASSTAVVASAATSAANYLKQVAAGNVLQAISIGTTSGRFYEVHINNLVLKFSAFPVANNVYFPVPGTLMSTVWGTSHGKTTDTTSTTDTNLVFAGDILSGTTRNQVKVMGSNSYIFIWGTK